MKHSVTIDTVRRAADRAFIVLTQSEADSVREHLERQENVFEVLELVDIQNTEPLFDLDGENDYRVPRMSNERT
ncbi:MAG: hypothetical protein J1G01_06525 [Clostridiales bacterium]|nr:hypothetical protein [Clostridiales bacterium]